MSEMAVAEHIRAHKQDITEAWERTVLSDVKELARIERGALIDHMPELLDGLAAWVEGRAAEAEIAFSALADGHALQRLGFGFELAVVNVEYARLRHVLLKSLLIVPSTVEVREQLIRLNDGLDRAIQTAVRRYSEHRDYMRDRFVSILGHDLRNPLGAASLAADGLRRSGKLDGAAQKRLSTIARSIERMERMTADVLDFARGHLAGGIPARPKECDMGEICRAAVDEALGAHPERTIELQTTGDLRGTFDPDRVLQALSNLLGNAILHGTDPIVVAAFESDDRRALITRVANRGERIPQGTIAKLFDPFMHAGDQAKGSLGLGLFIVAQIARAHGATYDVASSSEQTEFIIRWPRTPRDETRNRP